MLPRQIDPGYEADTSDSENNDMTSPKPEKRLQYPILKHPDSTSLTEDLQRASLPSFLLFRRKAAKTTSAASTQQTLKSR